MRAVRTRSLNVLIILLVLAGMAGPGRAADGDLDPGFGTGGIVTIVGGADPLAPLPLAAVALQADQKIIAGTTLGGDFVLYRLTTGGALDGTFGVGGVATVDLGGNDVLAALSIQTDGSIVAAGTSYQASVGHFGTARFDSTGAIDSTWGGTGTVVTPIGSGAVGSDVKIQNDGKVLVVGTADQEAVVVRYETNGAVDGGFGSSGVATVGSPIVTGLALAVQANGRIVVGGGTVGGVDYEHYGLARLLTNGTLDGTFGTGGTVATDGGDAWEEIQAIAVRNDGKIVAGGFGRSVLQVGPGSFTAIRYDSDGSLDGTFGSGGIAHSDPRYLNLAYAVVLQGDLSVVLVGTASEDFGVTFSFDFDFALSRFAVDGTLDPSWGSGGNVITPLPAQIDVPTDAAIQTDGKILAVGASSDGDLVVARYEASSPPTLCGNGLLDPGEECDDGNLSDGDCCSATCGYEPLGSPCSAAALCSQGQCDGAGVCEPTGPWPGCHTSTRPNAGVLRIVDAAGSSRDKIVWRLRRGEATTPAEMGVRDYRLCIFDDSGASQPLAVLSTDGDVCGSDPCWRGSSEKPRYADSDGTHDGIRRLVPRPGIEGKASLKLVAGKDNLSVPALPLSPPVTVQLHNDAGDCWEATYSSPAKNESNVFRAKSD